MTLYVLRLYPWWQQAQHAHTHTHRHTHTHTHTHIDPSLACCISVKALKQACWQIHTHSLAQIHIQMLMGIHALNHLRGASQKERERTSHHCTHIPSVSFPLCHTNSSAGKIEKHWIPPYSIHRKHRHTHTHIHTQMHIFLWEGTPPVSPTNTFVTDKALHSHWHPVAPKIAV